MDIEQCNRFPLSNAQATKDAKQYKRVIIKIVNRKFPECLPQI